MGIFDNLRRKRELDKLEATAKDSPSPMNLCAFAERLMAYEEAQRALEVAKKAMESFPENDRVVSTYRYITKMIHQSRINELQKSIEKSPNPGGYARLAELYFRELGDLDGAMEVARRGLAHFPEDESLHQISGQIRFWRFHEDYLAKDGTTAVEHFQKSITINNLNYRCLYLLAVLAAEIEAWDLARQSIGQIYHFAPDDEAVRSLETRLNEIQPKNAPREALDQLFRNVEVRGRLGDLGQKFSSLHPAESTAKHAGSRIDSRRMQDLLRGFNNVEGFQTAVIIDARGRMVAGHSVGKIPEEALAKCVAVISQCAQESSKRMDIGAFQRGEFETPAGTVNVIGIRNMTLGVGSAPHAKRDEVLASIDTFLDSVSREEAAFTAKK